MSWSAAAYLGLGVVAAILVVVLFIIGAACTWSTCGAISACVTPPATVSLPVASCTQGAGPFFVQEMTLTRTTGGTCTYNTSGAECPANESNVTVVDNGDGTCSDPAVVKTHNDAAQYAGVAFMGMSGVAAVLAAIGFVAASWTASPAAPSASPVAPSAIPGTQPVKP